MLPASPYSSATQFSARFIRLQSGLLARLSPTDAAFMLAVSARLWENRADESECVIALAALGLAVMDDESEALLTPEENAAATQLALALLNPGSSRLPDESTLRLMLMIADLRLEQLIRHTETTGEPDNAFLEAPEEFVEPFRELLALAGRHPAGKSLEKHLLVWIRLLRLEPEWSTRHRPAYWLIAPTGNRDLRRLHDLLRTAGFYLGKNVRHKGPATIDRIEHHDVLVVSSPLAHEPVFRRLMTSIAAHYPLIYVREMDQTQEGRSFVWEKMPQSIFQKGLIFKRMEVLATQDPDPLPALLDAFGTSDATDQA